MSIKLLVPIRKEGRILFLLLLVGTFLKNKKMNNMKQMYKILYVCFTNHLYKKKINPMREFLALLTSHINSIYQRAPQALWTQFTASVFHNCMGNMASNPSHKKHRRYSGIWRYFVVFLASDLKCGRPVTSAVAFLKGISLHVNTASSVARWFCHSLFFTFSCYRAHGICVFANVPKDATNFIFWSMLMIILVPLITNFNYYGY